MTYHPTHATPHDELDLPPGSVGQICLIHGLPIAVAQTVEGCLANVYDCVGDWIDIRDVELRTHPDNLTTEDIYAVEIDTCNNQQCSCYSKRRCSCHVCKEAK